MRTTDTMSTDVREVLLEVYVNDAFYFGDTYWASDDKDVQLEFEITDDIYDLISGSASRELDVQLEVVTVDHVSGRYCSPGEMRVQLEVNMRVEYATVRNTKKTFLQNDRSNSAWPEMDLNVREPKPIEDLVAPPKWDLVDAVELYTPSPSVPEPDSEEDLDDPLEREWDKDSMELYAPGSSVPEPDAEEDLVDSVELYLPGPSVLKPRPEWDLATPVDLGAPSPSVLEPESTVLSELASLENYVPLNMLQLEDRLKQCTLLKQRHVTNVWPRVFIGDEEAATDRDMLQEMCITHILNAAAPKKDLNYFLGKSYVEDLEGTVNTGSRYYRGLHINYYSLPTTDRHCSDISKCFMPAAKFIDKAVNKPGSKVLICCKQGVDHSATLFLAYLMICHDMMVEDAIDDVIKSRRIQPSRDFLKELMLLNADLVNKRKLKLEDIKKGKKRRKWQLKKKCVPNMWRFEIEIYLICTDSVYQITLQFKLTLPDTDYLSVSMRTTDTMSTDVREVLLEVYVNDAFYFGDTYWASDDKDVQLEFEITDDIYDLISSSASRELDVQLEVVTVDHVSGRYCSPGEMRVQLEVNSSDNISVCEVKDLQLEMNRNDSISELKSPTLVSEDLSDPAGPSVEEANDQGGLDAENSPTGLTVWEITRKMGAIFQQICAVFQAKMPETVGQPELDLPDPKESFVPDPSALKPEPEMDLLDTEQSCIPEPEVDLVVPSEPKLDLVDPEEACASPKETTKAMKNKKVLGFVVTKRVEYATVRNTKKTFLQNNRSNSTWPEMDLNVREPKPIEDLVAPPKWDLVDAVELYTPSPSVPEPDSEEDLDDPLEREWDKDSMELYAPGSSVPEPDAEEDLVDSVELYLPGPSVLKPRPEWDLATPVDLGAPSPSVLEPESTVLSELASLENYVPLNMLQLEDRLKQCTLLKQRHVTNVWPRVFIGDEEAATDRDMLQEMCITHILNAAAPKKDLNYFLGKSYVEDLEGTVNTGSRYYRGLHINYYSLPTTDRHCSDISKCFMPAAKFIDKAVNKPGSKVLICCKQGVDHSATLFLAYLMICHDMMVEDAIDDVIKSRRIQPSRDFLKELMLLNADLVNKRKLRLEDIKKGKKRRKWQLKKKCRDILKDIKENVHI
ncbi:uncharacterized protein LOC113087315 [Carassius auratus]|uniref:Uncharacterized protein LOC113087315 n=1 Tax=Carassius auratus TaxID=7957 RepID=A0A6P6NS08_CARAU|nr:uncharacterized protein LOC113087315 [Carassius auratus]